MLANRIRAVPPAWVWILTLANLLIPTRGNGSPLSAVLARTTTGVHPRVEVVARHGHGDSGAAGFLFRLGGLPTDEYRLNYPVLANTSRLAQGI